MELIKVERDYPKKIHKGENLGKKGPGTGFENVVKQAKNMELKTLRRLQPPQCGNI